MDDIRDQQGSRNNLEKGVLNSSEAASRGRRVVRFSLGERTLRMDKDRVIIGSVPSADVKLSGSGVSPIHAILELDPESIPEKPRLVIFDLASDTGVFVNGQKVVVQALADGDEIVIGSDRLKYQLELLENQLPKNQLLRDPEGRRLFVESEASQAIWAFENSGDLEPIFDYRPANVLALEAVFAWCGSILDVRHFERGTPVRLGGKKSDFTVALPRGGVSNDEVEHLLVSGTGETQQLQLTRGMTGVIRKGHQLRSIDSYWNQRENSAAEVVSIPFDKSDIAKIRWADVEFYLSFSPAPPVLKRRRLFEKDPLLLRVLFLSILLSSFLVVSLVKAPIPQAIEAEQLPERIATILYQPEKYSMKRKDPTPAVKSPVTAPPVVESTPTAKPTVVTQLDLSKKAPPEKERGNLAQNPKDLQKSKTAKGKIQTPSKIPQGARAQSEAKEGAGARAKGPEGTRGSKKAPQAATPQNLAQRPSPGGGSGAGGGVSQVPSDGNVDLLKGAASRIENLLGNSSQQLGKSGEKLKGFGGFDTKGAGGLGFAGSGAGGGGNAESLGGLSDRGKGGGRVGTGLGAAGNGAGIAGGASRVAIRTGGPEEGVVMGAIDAAAVEAAILAHKDEFRLCYEREINAERADLAGRVGTSFVIGSSGKVTQAGIESTSLRNANVERCVLTVLRRIDFPIPRGAGVVQVLYPFKFAAPRR
jgi:pSer/pThr/pTyr-binding forkhead associated (FHA) protein/outer membrane biosynthesis protein TonB